MSSEATKEAKSQFFKEYFKEPNREYLSWLMAMPLSKVVNEFGGTVPPGASLEEMCLVVGLKTIPPDDANLPIDQYKGIRIFYTMVDTTKALSNFKELAQ